MTGTQAPDWRARALREPEAILEDPEVMRALVAADDRRRGGNVVDMRGLAMSRLEDRLSKLEDAHRTVIENACENLAGTNQVQRAVLALLDSAGRDDLLAAMTGTVPGMLRVESARVVLEGSAAGDGPVHPAVACRAPGTIRALTGAAPDAPLRPVTLRDGVSVDPSLHAVRGIRSEALILLDLGGGRHSALWLLGSTDGALFRPGQGTDLLAFLGGCAERLLRRHMGGGGA